MNERIFRIPETAAAIYAKYGTPTVIATMSRVADRAQKHGCGLEGTGLAALELQLEKDSMVQLVTQLRTAKINVNDFLTKFDEVAK